MLFGYFMTLPVKPLGPGVFWGVDLSSALGFPHFTKMHLTLGSCLFSYSCFLWVYSFNLKTQVFLWFREIFFYYFFSFPLRVCVVCSVTCPGLGSDATLQCLPSCSTPSETALPPLPVPWPRFILFHGPEFIFFICLSALSPAFPTS